MKRLIFSVSVRQLGGLALGAIWKTGTAAVFLSRRKLDIVQHRFLKVQIL